MENNKIHVNTDLRQRFVPRRTIHIEVEQRRNDVVWKQEYISKGDYIVLLHNSIIYFGRVLNFKNLTSKNSIYFRDVVNVNSSENVGMMLNPLYSVANGQKMIRNIIQYFNVKFYKCHAKVDVDFTNAYDVNFIYTM